MTPEEQAFYDRSDWGTEPTAPVKREIATREAPNVEVTGESAIGDRSLGMSGLPTYSGTYWDMQKAQNAINSLQTPATTTGKLFSWGQNTEQEYKDKLLADYKSPLPTASDIANTARETAWRNQWLTSPQPSAGAGSQMYGGNYGGGGSTRAGTGGRTSSGSASYRSGIPDQNEIMKILNEYYQPPNVNPAVDENQISRLQMMGGGNALRSAFKDMINKSLRNSSLPSAVQRANVARNVQLGASMLSSGLPGVYNTAVNSYEKLYRQPQIAQNIANAGLSQLKGNVMMQLAMARAKEGAMSYDENYPGTDVTGVPVPKWSTNAWG